MRRAFACAAAAVALAVPATAAAATNTYEGKVKGDDQATVKLKVESGADGRTVKSFVVKDLLIDCEGNERARLKSATISGAAEVSKKGKFRVKGSNGGQEFAVRGKLRGKRHARGSLNYSGPTSVDGQTLDCASGKVGWKASR